MNGDLVSEERVESSRQGEGARDLQLGHWLEGGRGSVSLVTTPTG